MAVLALLLVLVGIGLSLALLGAVGEQKAQLKLWREAAKANGLTRIEELDRWPGTYLEARAEGGLHVRISRYGLARGQSETCISVRGLEREGKVVSLRLEGLGTAFAERFIGEREVELGSPAFDQEVFIQGPAPLAFALLDSHLRPLVGDLLHGGLNVDGRLTPVQASLVGGELGVVLRGPESESSGEAFPRVLAAVLAIARRLVPPPDVPHRIAENLAQEPERGVRLRALGLLTREFPDDPATRTALLAALHDASDEVRLRAATALGYDGRETLLELVLRDGTKDPLVAEAVLALGDGLPSAPLDETLRRALAAGRTTVACACLEEIGRRGHTDAEALILEAVKAEDRELAVGAVRALGEAGTAAAVPPLREASESRAELRGVARQAIAEIQSRIPGAGPGHLSLAAAEAGALSLAAGEAGQLSLSSDERQDAAGPGGAGRPRRSTSE